MSLVQELVSRPAAPVTDRRVAHRLVVAAGVCVVLAVVVDLLMVHTSLGQRFDDAALLGSRQQGNSTRLFDVSILRRITADSFAVVLALIVALGFLRRRPRLGIAVAVAAALAVTGTDLLRKVLLHRPQLVHSDSVFPGNTFPSGHTATAISCALALVVISPPAWRGISAVLAGSYAWFTATAVQTAGWHRPSDAIGAALLGFAAVATLTAVVAARRPIGVGRRIGHIPAYLVLGVVGLGSGVLSILHAERVLRFLAAHPDGSDPTPAVLNNAYQFSVDLTIVVVIALLTAFLILLGPADLDEPSS